MKSKTLAQLKKIAWKWLSLCVRQEAADRLGYVRCYTCDWVGMWTQAQASHAIPGRSGAGLFDESIIRCCCSRCNVALRGNYPVFTTRVIKENGMGWWETKLAASHLVKKWTRAELLDLIESYKGRLKALDR